MDLIVRSLTGEQPDKVYQYHEIETLPASHRKLFRELQFVTGNKNKVTELTDSLKVKHVKLTVVDLDLPEIQHSNSLNIVEAKCRAAFEKLNESCSEQTGWKVVLIEDTELRFKSLNSLPGPYIKWFLKAIGPEGLCKLLAGFEDKSAEAVCTYAIMDNPTSIIFFRGLVRGQIVSPRGASWGWDPVFEEQRCRLTFGEMDASMKGRFSHRANAITLLKKYLTQA